MELGVRGAFLTIARKACITKVIPAVFRKEYPKRAVWLIESKFRCDQKTP